VINEIITILEHRIYEFLDVGGRKFMANNYMTVGERFEC